MERKQKRQEGRVTDTRGVRLRTERMYDPDMPLRQTGDRRPAPERRAAAGAAAAQRVRRSTGGSRYADKAEARRPASGRSRRKAGRRRRRRGGNRRWPVFLLVILLVCLAAGLVLVYSQRKSAGRRQAEAKVQELQNTVDLSMLASPYAILLDGDSGSVLASKNGEDKIYPASMVKMMTVLTAIREISNLDATTTMSADYYEQLYAQDASRAGFEPGEEAKIRDLLYGALLPSGAECCMQLALEAAGSEAAFVEKMNQNAADMGLTQTHFTNATGLHNEDQYSTPHEIGEILRTALENKTFYEVFTTHSYTVQPTAVHPDGFTFWSSLFKNITDDSVNGGKIMGGKTGYTDEAGHCLASMAEIDGRAYILVTAGWAQTEDTQYHISDAFRAYNQIAS